MTAPMPINLRYIAFLACTAALGGLLFGFDIAIITGAGPFITREFALSDIGLGWAFSSLLFGCVLGCFIAGRLTDRYGRKKLLVLVALLFAVTSIATALATSFFSFVTARFLGGLAVGGVSLLSPMYAAEVSPPSVRGRMGTMYQMSIIVGIIVSYGINYLLRNTGPNNWRWMFLSGVAPSAVFLLCIATSAPAGSGAPRALAPRSPRSQQRSTRNRRPGGDCCGRGSAARLQSAPVLRFSFIFQESIPLSTMLPRSFSRPDGKSMAL